MNERTLIFEAVELIEQFMIDQHCADVRLLKAHDKLAAYLTGNPQPLSGPSRQLPALVTTGE